MTEPTNANDIDALLDLLAAQSRFGFHSAVTALVAERNELKQRVEYIKALNSTAVSIISERDALRKRVAELEAQPPADRDRDLRERLVESALRVARDTMMTEAEANKLGRQTVWIVNGALDAMRKGESDGK